MGDAIARRIEVDVRRLCDPGDRDLGTERNRAATRYVMERLEEAGVEVGAIEFEVPEWRFGAASVSTASDMLKIHAGPFSPAITGSGPLVPVRSPEDLPAAAPASVLLLLNQMASTQLTPREYPFYSNPDHAAILDALEAAKPLAVLAATDKSAMTGALSPFPVIEEARFGVPSAYMTIEQGAELARHAGEQVGVSIDSEVRPSTGLQPYGRSAGSSGQRVIISAHIDSKPETPGAIDNAAGVAIMLAVADLLRGSELRHTLEFVPFNGEDHTLAPGELAWLATNQDLSDVLLAINIDATGLPGLPNAYSVYNVDDRTKSLLEELAAEHAETAEGPQWPASDHMIFAMRGIAAVALTSTDFASASGDYSHTPKDVPEILDYELLADAAGFIATLVTRL